MTPDLALIEEQIGPDMSASVMESCDGSGSKIAGGHARFSGSILFADEKRGPCFPIPDGPRPIPLRPTASGHHQSGEATINHSKPTFGYVSW